MRISVRLDERSAHRLDQLVRSTESSISEVLKKAIDLYFAELRSSSRSAAGILQDTGFLAGFAAEPDLSDDYKGSVRKLIERRHGDR